MSKIKQLKFDPIPAGYFKTRVRLGGGGQIESHV